MLGTGNLKINEMSFPSQSSQATGWGVGWEETQKKIILMNRAKFWYKYKVFWGMKEKEVERKGNSGNGFPRERFSRVS